MRANIFCSQFCKDDINTIIVGNSEDLTFWLQLLENINITINVLFCEETRPGQQAVPDYLYDGDDAGTKTEPEYPTNVGHQSGESAVDVLGYLLTVRLFEIDID